MQKEQIKKIIKEFEANFLDGDKIDDCGGAKFTVSGVLDVAEFFYLSGREDEKENITESIKSHKFNFFKAKTGLIDGNVILSNISEDLCIKADELIEFLSTLTNNKDE